MSVVKLGSAAHDYFKKYDRKFIQLNRDMCLLIHLFEKDAEHSWEDVWLHDFDGIEEHDFYLYKESAKQLIDQLEGNCCRAFLEALRDECSARIEQDLINCGLKKKENENSGNE